MASVSSIAPNSVHQLTSEPLKQQAELRLTRRAEPNTQPLESIRSRKNQGQAFTLACNSSLLEDKEIYLQLEIDSGTFARLKKGTNTLPGDLLRAFCEIVGNTIYPEWLAFQTGNTLVQIESESQREARMWREKYEKEREHRIYAEDLATRRMG